MNKLCYLKNGLLYRKEKDFILLRDCINLLDYELPLESYSLLKNLTLGCDISTIKNEVLLNIISDFKDMHWLSFKKEEKVLKYQSDISLSYNEKEFF